MRTPLHRCLLLAAALATAASASAQQHALTLNRNLDQLTDRAALIVRGHVVSARVEKHPQFPGLDTVVVSLRVRETLKGAPRQTHSFRQFLWDIRDRLDANGYRKGQEVILFLIEPSAHGLSSPAGLDQGRFRIERNAAGEGFAVNGQGNFRLFEGLAGEAAKEGATLSPASLRLVDASRGGPVALADFTRLVRELAAVDR